jgi:hypothetical protein
MGFIEIIFMGTLGALFVLLALLIYHYKRQLNKLETKYDTMFEIINSLVKEVYQVKSDLGEVAAMRIQSQHQQQQQHNPHNGSFMFNQLLSSMLPTIMDEDYVSSESDYEQPEDSIKQIFIHPGFSEFDVSSSAAPIDIASSNIAPIDIASSNIAPIDAAPIDIAPIDISLGEDEPITLEVSDLNEDSVSSEPKVEKPVEAPQIVIDNIRPAFLDVEVSDLEDDIVSVMTNDRRKPYSKMNVQELRQEAANQGITTDVSKMKKHDIASLLRQHRKTKA